MLTRSMPFLLSRFWGSFLVPHFGLGIGASLTVYMLDIDSLLL